MRSLLASMLVCLAAGCGGGPDVDTLKKDVVARVTNALPDGAVTFASLERRGSQADAKAPAGETRRTVYFDVALKLERDVDFGAWDAPGVAGLVSALGAGPKGITGLMNGGNKAGDRILVHGTALYKREGEGWVVVPRDHSRPAAAPSIATNEPEGRAAVMLATMRRIVESIPKEAGSVGSAIIEEELATATANIRGRLARAQQGYAIAAGPERGQYLRFAQAISDAKAIRAIALISRGGEENLKLLRNGKVALALAQADAARDAYEGKGSFASEGPNLALRAAGSLYPEAVHVLVRGDSGITAVTALRGRRVAIGQEGSAARTTALRVLEAHGIRAADFKAYELAVEEALGALQRKEVDAFIHVIGVPAEVLRTVFAGVPARFLPLADNAVSKLAAGPGGYFPYTIHRGVYDGAAEDVSTVATAALLLVGSDLSPSEVASITRFVYERGRDLVARGSVQGGQVAASTARHGLTVPLHAAAAGVLDTIAPVAPLGKSR